MAIPQHLDTFVGDTIIIEPHVGLQKSTMEAVIVAKVIDRVKNVIVDIQVFSDEQHYLDFVNQTFA
jgi:hypothetical protein